MDKEKNFLNKILIVFICTFAIINCQFNFYINNLTTAIDNQSKEIIRISERAEQQQIHLNKVDNETKDWGNEIKKIYEMNKSHANCVAMAVLMNEKGVLAESYERTVQEQEKLHSDDEKFANFYGRLYVPDAKIDVALYTGNAQYICDMQDSANIFSYGLVEEKTIADHSNQEFRKLFSVKVGMEGYIKLKNGEIINIVCTDIFDGYNNGMYITDKEGNDVMRFADYVMYTCKNGWQNIIVCAWEKF